MSKDKRDKKNEYNIILTGFMGTGKTAVGTELALRLERKFVDTDHIIEIETGMSIREIFEKYGEEYFRERESEAAAKLLTYPQGEIIAATGGGIILRKENRLLLRKAGMVILLTASLPEILNRIGGCAGRPLLDQEHPLKKISAMQKEREPYYREHNYCFDTTGKTVNRVCDEIIEKLELY